MHRYRSHSPSMGDHYNQNTQAIEHTLMINAALRKARASLLWGLVNVCLLACLIYDLAYKCPIYTSTFNYFEYALCVVFSLNMIYHLCRYFYFTFYMEPVIVTPSQKKLLGFKDSDPYYGPYSIPYPAYVEKYTPNILPLKSPYDNPYYINDPKMYGYNSEYSHPVSPYHDPFYQNNEINQYTKVPESPPFNPYPTPCESPMCKHKIREFVDTSEFSEYNSHMTPTYGNPYCKIVPKQYTSTPENSPYIFSKTPNDSSLQSTPLNLTATSWRSRTNESQNMSLSSPSWIYYRASPESDSFYGPPSKYVPDTSGLEYIMDEKALKQYLTSFEHYEKSLNTSNPNEQSANLLSTFWSHPATQTTNDASMYLRKCQYQLSLTNSSAATNSPTGKVDESSPLNISQKGHEVWRRLSIEPQTLTQWNANLRMWISQTILERLVEEINFINNEFQKYHLTDVKIGSVGLDRLRKTAQTSQVSLHIPTLSSLLPFLEVTPNQEYVVKRIKELAKGGCMSEFKWNSGGDYNGKEWDDSLITDSAIIIHMLSTYLDSQLLPLPNQPDAKLFSKQHFVKINDKVPQNVLTLAIQQVSDKPPHFRLIVGEEMYEVAKGHNNLFHTILLFLYYVNKKEHGMLGKVNMGKSGVNMLWIINC